MAASIQDRTAEFRSVLTQAQRRQATSKVSAQRQSLLSNAQKQQAHDNAPARKSEFAKRAAEIGRSIGATMGKLEKLALLAKRKTLFDDRPVEINELTFVIKQDLSTLNQQIAGLQSLTRQQHPGARDQEGEHNKNVVLMLQGKLSDVGANFKDVLEVRTKNMQASRSRTENFISQVSQHVQPQIQQSASPLYGTPQRGTPSPGGDLLSLNPVGDQQLLMMEEAQPQNTYIQQRGEAIETIESTINELGSIFGQLAEMVSQQAEMIERIDANTEDVVENVQGAQRELLKYFTRVSSNRWLIAKMFGVLMIFFLLWVLVAG
ncbi:SNARE domain-containing protein [Xylariaceae sp. FL1272]|nr:SNARE domain-containing protein [Xylariaceae sp. FL1272]